MLWVLAFYGEVQILINVFRRTSLISAIKAVGMKVMRIKE